MVSCEKHFKYVYVYAMVRIDQGVTNQNRFSEAFEERCHNIHAQQCLSEIHNSNRCRMYKEVKLSFSASFYAGLKYSQIFKNIFHKIVTKQSYFFSRKRSNYYTVYTL